MFDTKSTTSAVLLFFSVLLLFTNVAAQNQTNTRSFYAVTHYFSDFLPASYDEILDVSPEGRNVRIRVVRLSNANPYCPGELVRAVERVLPDLTLMQVSKKVDVCSYNEQNVSTALDAAIPKYAMDPSDSASLTIVAQCETGQKTFDFPHPSDIDEKALRKKNPRIFKLWNLSYTVSSRAFGKQFTMHDLPQATEKQYEELGTKLIPELRSGKFDAGFDSYTCGGKQCDQSFLAWLLGGYDGPPKNPDPSSVELVNASSLHLVKYDLPTYSPIAKMARISGEVHLKIVPDLQSRGVKDVQLISGSRILGDASVEAARQWQFAFGLSSKEPMEAVLKFTLCANQ
jgi:hypothetical protein